MVEVDGHGSGASRAVTRHDNEPMRAGTNAHPRQRKSEAAQKPVRPARKSFADILPPDAKVGQSREATVDVNRDLGDWTQADGPSSHHKGCAERDNDTFTVTGRALYREEDGVAREDRSGGALLHGLGRPAHPDETFSSVARWTRLPSEVDGWLPLSRRRKCASPLSASVAFRLRLPRTTSFSLHQKQDGSRAWRRAQDLHRSWTALGARGSRQLSRERLAPAPSVSAG